MRGKSVFFWLLRDSPEAFEVILIVILTIIQTLTAHHSGLFPDCVQMWRCHVLLLSKMGSSFAVLAAKLQYFAGVERQKRGGRGQEGAGGETNMCHWQHVTTRYNMLHGACLIGLQRSTNLPSHPFIATQYQKVGGEGKLGRYQLPTNKWVDGARKAASRDV